MFEVVCRFRLGSTVGEVERLVVLDVARRLLEIERCFKGQPRCSRGVEKCGAEVEVENGGTYLVDFRPASCRERSRTDEFQVCGFMKSEREVRSFEEEL